MDSKFKVNNLDLLRILAATQVVVVHTASRLGLAKPSWWPVLEAFPGVAIFFVISGFLISASYENSSGLKGYFRNRLLRIYPGLWCCVLVTIPVAMWFGVSFANRQAAPWLICQLVGLIYTPRFLKVFGFGSYNGSLWTIPVELQFYFLLPALYAIARPNKHRNLIIGLAWLAFTAISFGVSLVYSPLNVPADAPIYQRLFGYTFVPHVYLFFTGVLLQRLSAYKSTWIAGKGFVWLVIYLGAESLLRPWEEANIPLKLLLGVTTISMAYTLPKIAHRVLHGNDISYGVYMYHGLFINIFIEMGLTGYWRYVGWLAVCAYLAGYLSWMCVEKPFLRRKKQTIAPDLVLNPAVPT